MNSSELPMTDAPEARYVSYYTATLNVKDLGAVIEVMISDDYGNVTTERAEGKWYINTKK
ncbi:hypothetical protein [Bacillus sp. AFS015802]|uniref:hypothetical protein n=1 Tax=Bacillus sp. AFS015802 TaxID=2033486 RepID=UPI0011553155|nr:hypothetical protein [Bacillus sp. AFS015802]